MTELLQQLFLGVEVLLLMLFLELFADKPQYFDRWINFGLKNYTSA